MPPTENSKVLVQPITRSWTCVDPVCGVTLHVQRTGLALMPETACPLYSLQGLEKEQAHKESCSEDYTRGVTKIGHLVFTSAFPRRSMCVCVPKRSYM